MRGFSPDSGVQQQLQVVQRVRVRLQVDAAATQGLTRRCSAPTRAGGNRLLSEPRAGLKVLSTQEVACSQVRQRLPRDGQACSCSAAGLRHNKAVPASGRAKRWPALSQHTARCWQARRVKEADAGRRGRQQRLEVKRHVGRRQASIPQELNVGLQTVQGYGSQLLRRAGLAE